MALTPVEQRQLYTDLIRHVIAVIVVSGFFGVVAISLLGLVDITNSAVTAFVGTALGYAAAQLKTLSDFYYPSRLDKEAAGGTGSTE